MRIAVIACDMIKRELEQLIADDADIEEVVWLEAALHVYPERMRDRIVEEIARVAPEVDAVFLGYGYCQSLKGIEDGFDVPVVLPQFDDCISIMLTPERYAEEIDMEVGTWFMSPGWAEVGADMVIKELKLDRALKYGRDPLEMAKRLFTHYKRGLLIDTGVGDMTEARASARKFCEDFNLTLEETSERSPILARELERCKRMALVRTGTRRSR